jgi:hypothetical protein
LGEDWQRQKQIPFGDDNQKSNCNRKSNCNCKDKSRSPSGMTTRKATAIGKATAPEKQLQLETTATANCGYYGL